MSETAWWRTITPYSCYVLLLLLLTYLLNQLDRYMLAITSKPMAQEIHFGDEVCMVNTTFSATEAACNATSRDACVALTDKNGSEVCEWNYNGQGYEYQIVAGPVFIVIYTFMGIFVGFAADLYNRKILLAICLLFWSLMTLLTGFIESYWQLVVLRFGLGLGEAGCTPFAASLLADYFEESVRGLALGVYNWGIYMGYSMSYAVGNFITVANINGQGWRWTFYLSAIPGFIVGVLILLTLKETERFAAKAPTDKKDTQAKNQDGQVCSRLKNILKPFVSPSLLLLCIAGSIRNGAGYVWAYNTQPYFNAIGQTWQEEVSGLFWVGLFRTVWSRSMVSMLE